MRLYKLTDQDGYTRRGDIGEALWETGKTLTLPTKSKPQLCTPDVIHAYTNVNLAFLLNPEHANIENPRCWRGIGAVAKQDWGQVGTFSLTIQYEHSQPSWYVDESTRRKVVVMFAVLCAESVLYIYESHVLGDDRPRKAIEAARGYIANPPAACASASRAASDAALTSGAAFAADAARAAQKAADTASAADLSNPIMVAVKASKTAAYAARASRIAAHVSRTVAKVTFGALADHAVKEITGD